MIDSTDLEGFVKRTVDRVQQLEKEGGIDMTPEERESLEAELKEEFKDEVGQGMVLQENKE